MGVLCVMYVANTVFHAMAHIGDLDMKMRDENKALRVRDLR